MDVPSARKWGFQMVLHEDVMRDVLNSSGVVQVLASEASVAESGIETHVRATASMADAENYVASLFNEASTSDEYNMNFEGPFALGNRPIRAIGIPSGRGSNPRARPPFMTEARTHALTSVAGFEVGGGSGEDAR